MWILGLKGLKKCACEKTSTLKVDHRDVAIQFYPWFKFFFSFFLRFKLIIIHYFTRKTMEKDKNRTTTQTRKNV